MKQRKDARNHERSFALSARKVRRFAEGKPPWQHTFQREDMNFHMLEQGAFP